MMIVYPSICYICSVFFNDAKPTIQSNFTSLLAFVASSASFSNRIFCLKKKMGSFGMWLNSIANKVGVSTISRFGIP